MKSSLRGKEMAIDDIMDLRGMRVPGYTPCYISVDIEATGPTPGHYSMYELGACVVGGEGKFERNIALLPNGKFHNEALRAVGTTRNKLLKRSNTVSPKKAMREFAQWSREMAQGDELIFVANNAPFDWMFIAWYFEETQVKNPFGHAALDMKAYFMGKSSNDWKRASLAQMAQCAGARFEKLPHKALEDALIQSNIFALLLQR